MSTQRLSARNRRALVFGAAAIVPILLYVAAVRPYVSWVGVQRDVIERERDLFQRERRLLVQANEYPARLLSMRDRVEGQRQRAFEGPDPVTTTALFVRHAVDLAAEHDVRIDRTEARAAEEATAGHELRVSLRATGDVSGVLRWLRALERSSRLVVVERLVVDHAGPGASRTFASRVSDASDPPAPELLAASVDLLAFGARMAQDSAGT